MIYAFKDLKIKYLLSAFGGILVILVLALPRIGTMSQSVLMIFAMFAWVLFCVLLFMRLANKRANAIYQLLYDCKVAEFLAQLDGSRALLGAPNPGKKHDLRRNSRFFVTLNYATGLRAYGDFDQALRVLEEVEPKYSTKPLEAQYFEAWMNCRAGIALRMGDLECMERCMNAMRQLMQEPEVKDPVLSATQKAMEVLTAQWKMKTGDCEGAQGYLETVFANPRNLFEKVTVAYSLAEVMHDLGDREKEHEYLDFVAKNGGDTFHACEAKRLLADWA